MRLYYLSFFLDFNYTLKLKRSGTKLHWVIAILSAFHSIYIVDVVNSVSYFFYENIIIENNNKVAVFWILFISMYIVNIKILAVKQKLLSMQYIYILNKPHIMVIVLFYVIRCYFLTSFILNEGMLW